MEDNNQSEMIICVRNIEASLIMDRLQEEEEEEKKSAATTNDRVEEEERGYGRVLERLLCFSSICRISAFHSSFIVQVIIVLSASIKSAQHLLPAEILTAIIGSEWHKTASVFCDCDQNVACARRSLKSINFCGRREE